MLKQYFNADEYQNYSAEDLSLLTESVAEAVAYGHSDCGEQEGHDPDDAHRDWELDVQKREGYADGEGVYACCNGQEQHGLNVQLVVDLVVLPGEGVLDHSCADQSEKDEGYPVVDACYQFFECAAQQIADHRHQCLKAAEPQTDDSGVFSFQLAHGKTLAYRYREGVRGESYSEHQHFVKAHIYTPF